MDQHNFSIGFLLDQFTTFPIESNIPVGFVGQISSSIGLIQIQYIMLVFCWTNRKYLLDFY